jgi:hypothetical protein
MIIKKVFSSLKSKINVNLQFLYYNKFHSETNQPKKSSYRLIVLLQSKCRGALFTCKRQKKGNFERKRLNKATISVTFHMDSLFCEL